MKRSYPLIAVVGALLVLVLLFATDGHPQYIFKRRDGSQLRADLLVRAHDDFSELNDKIRTEYGFDFKEPTQKAISCYNSQDSMDTKHYDTCQFDTQAKPIPADANFITKWHKTSPALEDWLRQHGWRKTWNENQPIAEILDKPHNDTSIAVNYEKKANDISCTIRFSWIEPHTPNQIVASEECAGSTR